MKSEVLTALGRLLDVPGVCGVEVWTGVACPVVAVALDGPRVEAAAVVVQAVTSIELKVQS